jgi:hypothetical protein
VRPERPVILPGSGHGSTAEVKHPQSAPAAAAVPQDEVKVQWDNPDQTVIYQFVNQHGSLILQVPSEQVLNLSRDISQELAQDAARREPPASDGGKNNGR